MDKPSVFAAPLREPVIDHSQSGSCRLLFLLLLSAVSLILLSMAWHCWPALDGDASAYVPPMVFYAKGDGLINPAWPALSEYDPLGKQRFVCHGFLYQMVVGSLTRHPTYSAVLLLLGVFEVMALWCCAFVVYRAAISTSGAFGVKQFLLAGMSIVGMATTLLGHRGRPEPFAILIVAATTCLVLRLKARGDWLILGCGLGLLATAHPVGAVLAGSLLVAYGCVSHSARACVGWLFRASIACAIITSLALMWYPFSLGDWVEGCRRHSAAAVAATWKDDTKWLYYWFTAPHVTFFGGVCLSAGGIAVSLLYRFWKEIRFKSGFVLAICVFGSAAYYFGCRVPARNYNLMVLSPLIYGVILSGVGCLLRPPGGATRSARSGWIVVAGLLLLSGAGFARYTALFPFFLKHGMTYDQARHWLEEFRGQHKDVVQVTSALYFLTEDYDGIVFSDTPKVTWIVVQQANSGRLNPPSLQGFRLVENHFSRVIPRFLGVALGRTVQGYNFAVYEREAASSQEGIAPPGMENAFQPRAIESLEHRLNP